MQNISKLLNLNMPVILASRSPRRRKLLEQMGIDFTVRPSCIDEDSIPVTEPSEYVKELALKKARDIAAKTSAPAIILGADTTVVLDGQILNKPDDESHAVKMLNTLSGNKHTVYTGIALAETVFGETMTAVQRTEVTFRDLSTEEIDIYVKSGSPMDKAGAYGIQDDMGAIFVSSINGCYYNIVGLPLELLYTCMKQFLQKNGSQNAAKV